MNAVRGSARLHSAAPSAADSVAKMAAMAITLQLRAIAAEQLASAGGDVEAIHRPRVRVKKFRYALEPLRAVGSKPARRMLRRLERLQERVGMYHDAATAAAWLRGWAAEPHGAPPAAMMAAGAIIRSLERRRRRANMDELARDVLHELDCAAAHARRALKPPLTLIPMVRAS